MALLFYRLKRIHDIAKRKYIQEGQLREVAEEPAVPEQGDNISEKSDDLTYLHEESAGTAPSDETIEVAEEPAVPEQGDNISEKLDDLTYLHEESAGTAPSDETIEVAEEPAVPEQVDNISEKSDDLTYLHEESAGTAPSDETIEVAEEPAVPEQGDNISEKSDDSLYLNEESAGIAPSDETIEVVEDIAEPLAISEEAQFNLGVKYSEGQGVEQDYEEAVRWVKKLNRKVDGLAGFRDWRLPTLEELATLVESSRKNSGLYLDSLFDDEQWWLWACDKHSSGGAWGVDFYDGYVTWYEKSFNRPYVRPVRSMK
jgi:hypothetical protein